MDEYDDIEAVMEEPFKRIESQHTEARMERLERLLEEMERELDEFLAEADRTSVR